MDSLDGDVLLADSTNARERQFAVMLVYNVHHNKGQIVKHKSVGSGTDRVQVPVQPDLRRALKEQPQRFGLNEGTSEAAKLAKLVEVGAAALEEQQLRHVRLQVYAEWSDDPEREAVAEANFDYSVAEGLL